MGTGELSSVSMSGRPELPAGRSTVEKVIAPEKLGARVVEALLMVLLVKVDAEVEAAGAVAVAAATEVLSVEQVVETEETVAPHKAF